jgi:hypothetical protein
MQMAGKNVTEKGYELGAFARGELRGSGQALYIEALGAHLFFVTVYANRAGELLNFKLYNGREELSLKETLFFSTDAQTGSVAAPHPFQMPVATPVEEVLQATGRFDIMPNPFAGETLLRFDAERAGQARVTVLDVLGGVKGYWDVSVSTGTNDYRWDGNAGAGRLPAGIYLIRLEVDGRALTRKVVVQ